MGATRLQLLLVSTAQGQVAGRQGKDSSTRTELPLAKLCSLGNSTWEMVLCCVFKRVSRLGLSSFGCLRVEKLPLGLLHTQQ